MQPSIQQASSSRQPHPEESCRSPPTPHTPDRASSPHLCSSQAVLRPEMPLPMTATFWPSHCLAMPAASAALELLLLQTLPEYPTVRQSSSRVTASRTMTHLVLNETQQKLQLLALCRPNPSHSKLPNRSSVRHPFAVSCLHCNFSRYVQHTNQSTNNANTAAAAAGPHSKRQLRHPGCQAPEAVAPAAGLCVFGWHQ
jgi:hypothetical protein